MDDWNKKLSLIYMFAFEVDADTVKLGRVKAKPKVKKCELFGESIGAKCFCDCVDAVIDDRFWARVLFSIIGEQQIVLPKVAALFAFAAVNQLALINEFYYTKEG